jgi:dephospho-CoA kinase
MKLIGLTGGIASGKSAVARMFAELGARVESADADARAVLEPGGAALPGVRAAFPEALNPDGTINRPALASRVFADDEARKLLNSLTHPHIRQRMRAAMDTARAAPGSGLLVYEVPLLFEGGLETWFDATVATLVDPAVQAGRLQERERAAGRPPLTPDQLADRLSAQLPNDEKARRADYVIRTDVPIEETRARVAELWRELTAPTTPG